MARISSFLAAALSLVSLAAPASAEPKAVVELFTSQGCSSCLAADAYFAELAERDDVIALSLHVDYWDYLGWQDTLGKPEHSERQRKYGEVHGTKRVYTPQVVVNGTKDIVGSDRAAIEAVIAQSGLPVPVTLRREAGTLKIDVGALPRPGRWRTTIRVVLFTSRAKVEITRGENAGSTVIYRNVVREIRPVGMWDGAPVRITLPEDELMGDGIDGSAVLVQEDLAKGPGAIVGAAQLRIR